MNVIITEYDDSKNNVILSEMFRISHTHPALYKLVNQLINKNKNADNKKYCLIIKMKLAQVEALNSVKGGGKFYRTFIQNKKGAYSILNNSSIWIRMVDTDDSNAEKNAKKEFEYFDKIGLYDYNSAKENLEYNIRLQKENYLDSSAQVLGVQNTQVHGVHVTPVLYGDECEFQQILEGNKKTL